MAGIEKFRTQSFSQRLGNDDIYGQGTDGNVTVSSDTSITSDMYYNNLTVNSGVLLKTNGYRVFVKNTLTLNGYIGSGSVTAGVVGEPTAVTTKTTVGTNTVPITYNAGGVGGGGTNPGGNPLPLYLFKSIDAMAGGLVPTPSGFQNIGGGVGGTAGAPTAGAAPSPGSPGTAGAAGSYAPNAHTVGAVGGRGGTGGTGNAGTPGTSGVSGIGGAGGAVVCVVAKTVVGTGKIISLGMSGVAGTAGGAGTAGTAGGTGTPAPAYSHPNPNVNVAHPATHNPDHHHYYTNHSNMHKHGVRQHVQQHENVQEHVHALTDAKHGAHGAHSTPHHFHRGTPHHHATPHHHHNGHHHSPHNDGPHGGAHHWEPHWWHAYFQITHHYPFPHYHQKPNSHGGHSHGATTGHNHHMDWIGNAGGSDNHIHFGNNHPHHNNGVGVGAVFYAGPSGTTARHSHHPNSVSTHVAPTVYPGGAGGAGGAGGPAIAGPNGKRGGAGGGGAILIVTDSIANTITYDTRAGLTVDSDNYVASAGAAYVLINS
jgi:hypothetical protein